MNIDICFTDTTNKLLLFADAIKFVEKRPFSHVVVIYYSEFHQTKMVFHATGAGVHLSYYDEFIKENQIVKSYSFDFNEQETKEFHVLIDEMMGRKYSWLDILGIFWRKITHLRNPFSDGLKTVICSELGARVCKIKKLPIPEPLDDITPSDLENILNNI